MAVKQEYIKNKDNSIISPITSVESVYAGNINLVDFFYPVGTYYETSIESFDPNKVWGGTWIKDTEGLTTVGVYQTNRADPSIPKVKIAAGEVVGAQQHYHMTTWGFYTGTAGTRYKVTDTDWGAISTVKKRCKS